MFSRTASRLLVMLGVSGVLAPAAWGDNNNNLRAKPWVFVGEAGDCGLNYPAGSNIVTSAWLGGMGLPDNGELNTQSAVLNSPPISTPTSRRDPHTGLLLNKNGPTSDCSSSGASIKGFRPGSVITELGFDYRLGTHCGGGAPRFNIVTTGGLTYFAGCGTGLRTPAPQDPSQWERVRFGPVFAQIGGSPPFQFGVTQVRSIDIVYDEGTDSTGLNDPAGVGLAVIDNIDINGTLITSGHGIAVPRGHRGRDEADD